MKCFLQNEDRLSSLQMNLLDFLYVSPLRNHIASKTTTIEKKRINFVILTSVKFRGEMDEMSESFLRVQPIAKCVMYF